MKKAVKIFLTTSLLAASLLTTSPASAKEDVFCPSIDGVTVVKRGKQNRIRILRWDAPNSEYSENIQRYQIILLEMAKSGYSSDAKIYYVSTEKRQFKFHLTKAKMTRYKREMADVGYAIYSDCGSSNSEREVWTQNPYVHCIFGKCPWWK